ncbi:MAG: galactokinase [Propionibacteriaceae bacterium]|nr:galactokinase [Propionibacteriaceae bacterium]
MAETSAAAASALFEQAYGGSQAGLWAAPGRVNLIGEHVDYNAGLVLPIALPQRAYAAARPRADRLVRFASAGLPGVAEVDLDDIAPGRPADWSRYPAGVFWALRRAGHDVGGLDLAFASDVPIGAGLSSSAAIEGAAGAAVSDLFGLGLLADDASRAELARLCQRAENEIALAPTGGMDQAAALRCQAGHALNLDCRDGAVAQIPFDAAAAGLVLLVIDTKSAHALGDGGYGARRADCEQAVRELGLHSLREIAPDELGAAVANLSNDRLRRRVRHVVTEIERVRRSVVALRAGDFALLGELFDLSHASLRDDYEVSCPELNTAQEAALAGGAIGARMTGGGFGGSAIALIEAAAAGAVEDAVRAAFAAAGHARSPACLAAVPAGPAGRIA